MLRRLARTLILLFAVYGLVPGGERAIEQVVELVGHGHLAHTVPDEPDPFASEHGCTPAEPNCECAHAQPTAPYARAEARPVLPGEHLVLWLLDADSDARNPSSGRRFAGDDVPPANRSTAPPTPPANA